MPFGTILGVLTIIVLLRPGVQTLFEQTADGYSYNEYADAY